MKSILAMTLVAVIAATTAAHAYEAKAGNRAANFSGYDIVNQRSISLDDYLGQWVFVEFWATWCGPCMRELPNMIAETKPYIDAGRLTVITVNGDLSYELTDDGIQENPGSLDKLKQVIRDVGLQCPVVYDGGVYDEERRLGNPLPALEWGIKAWPSSFLINPQGVIVLEGLRGPGISDVLDFYLDHPYPLVSVESSHELNADGSLTVTAVVFCSTREPAELALNRYWETWKCDENDPQRVVNDIDRGYETHCETVSLTFDEYGQAEHEFVLTPALDHDSYGYGCSLQIPGTPQISGAKYAGFWIWDSNQQAEMPGIKFIDGAWRALPLTPELEALAAQEELAAEAELE